MIAPNTKLFDSPLNTKTINIGCAKIRLMEIYKDLRYYLSAIGQIIGYIAILTGIIMTILILRTIFEF